MNDFYIVLPSNGCPNTQPGNHATKFIIDWENSIILEGNWKAALTEFTTTITPTTISAGSRIDYVKKTITHEEKQLVMYKKSEVVGFENEVFGLKVSLNRLKKVCIQYNAAFSIKLGENHKNFGFEKNEYSSNLSNAICADNELKIDDKFESLKLSIKYVRENAELLHITLPENRLLYDGETLCGYLLIVLKDILKSIFFRDGKISLKFHEYISMVQFPEDLAFTLGFIQSKFYSSDPYYKAANPPQLNRSFSHMYIYTSLTRPVLVGGVEVPLLRSIWINSKDVTIGESIHVNVDKPMYIPIASSSINNIEVNIRSDSGELLSLPKSSVTSLTIHLKKDD